MALAEHGGQPARARRVGEIEGQPADREAVGRQPVDRRLPVGRPARGEIDTVIGIPGPRQRPRQGKADAPRRAGDHRDAPSHDRRQAAAAIAANWRAEFRQVNPMA